MDKNTILAIVLSAIVLIGYTVIQVKFFPQQQPSQVVENVENSNEAVNEVSVVDASTGEIVSMDDIETTDVIYDVPASYTITTDKIKVTFTNEGGDVTSFQLLEHKDNKTGEGVEMADNITAANRAFSMSFGGADKKIISDIFVVKEFPVGENGEQKIAFAKKYSDFTLVKQYTFLPGEYMFRLNVIIDGKDGTSLSFPTSNAMNAAYTLRTSPQIGPFFDPKIDRYENRSLLTMNDGKGKRTMLGTKQFKEYNKPFTWAGIGGKYFCEVVIPVNKDSMQNVFYSSMIETGNQSNAQALLVRKPINEKQTNDVYYIYVGPRSEKVIKKYNIASENGWGMDQYKLTEAMLNSGWLGWLEAILKAIMQLIYKIIPNWGLSIIVMTVIIKLILFPMTVKSSMGTLKMQEIQPRMKAIQEKYKDNPQKLQMESAKLYKEVGYNPMAGCLPMIFQMLLLWAMFNLFNNYFEFRGAGFVKGWIDDLSSGDSIYTLNFWIPLIGNHIRILPVIYLASQLLYGKITQIGGTVTAGQSSGQMKFMMYGMPILFFFMFYQAPAGLILFWTVSNLLQMVQQLITNKIIGKSKSPVVVKMPNKKGKK